MLKVYGIQGRTQALITIPFNGGRGKLELEFEHGRIGAASLNRPATYSTDDPAKQAIIEGSKFFGGLVTVVRTYGEPEPAPVKVAAAPKSAPAAAPAAAAKKYVEPIALADEGLELAPDEQGGNTQQQGQGATATDSTDAGLEKGSDASKRSSGKKTAEEHPEVTTKEEALALLKSKGAKATDLASDEAAKAFAAKKGITFPNVEL